MRADPIISNERILKPEVFGWLGYHVSTEHAGSNVIGRFFLVMSLMEKRAKRTRDNFAGHFFWEIEVCKRNVRSGFRLDSRIVLSEASSCFFCFSSSPSMTWF